MESKWKRVRTLLRILVQKKSAHPLKAAPSPSPNSASPSAPSPPPNSASASAPSPSPNNASVCASAPFPPPNNAFVSASASAMSTYTTTSQNICAICLESMKPGHGHALFTAECSHSFHFSCIKSSVSYGNLVCPICRTNWTELPWQAAPPLEGDGASQQQQGPNPIWWPSHLPSGPPLFWEDYSSPVTSLETLRIPPILNDNPLNPSSSMAEGRGWSSNTAPIGGIVEAKIEITAYPQWPAVAASEVCESFMVLVHLKAVSDDSSRGQSRAPLDLVTVLDVSGSMSGNKLRLLKKAMAFLIENLGPDDRLSVVVFSSSARKLFGMQRMEESGRRQACAAVDSLVASGGTNIVEGLKMGAEVLALREHQNPVASIMLLSDGVDSFGLKQLCRNRREENRVVPDSIRNEGIPIHTFGFGSDHDAITLSAIAGETLGGTFSFIGEAGAVQDAFAQCIGGLLSVTIRDARLTLSCAGCGRATINSIQSGSYVNSIMEAATSGVVNLGYLYMEEERDVLVDLKIPLSSDTSVGVPILNVACTYRDPVVEVGFHMPPLATAVTEVKISRPEVVLAESRSISLEVDRHLNRLHTVQLIAEARSRADMGEFPEAQTILTHATASLRSSPSAMAGDHVCQVLHTELTEIQSHVQSKSLYDNHGRAYLLSAVNSHHCQRANARSSMSSSIIEDSAYSTRQMSKMVAKSQSLQNSTRNPKPPRP